ncbi:unnamed protein product [Brassica oleracea var. botrytis]
MALLNAIFSVTHFASSSVIRCHSRFPAQISTPDLSPACFSDRRKFVQAVVPLSTRRLANCRVYASANSTDATTPSYPKLEGDDDEEDLVPKPMVLIDQDADPEATIVQLSFGDRLGALIDTMKALKDLGLDVIKGTVTTEGSIKQTRFSITKLDTGRKVEDPDLLEQIRLTIINNLLKYHPECSEQLAMGETFGIKAPENKIDVDIGTHIHVKEDGPKRSLLCIETADRPGLVVEMIKVMADINIDVESAEIDTEGLVAKDKFHVSYQGQALDSSLSQTVVLKVAMPCEGCVGAVKRVLGKMQGVESFDVDLKEQKVTVKGNVEPEAVLQTVSKTGKKTSFWGADEAETAKA